MSNRVVPAPAPRFPLWSSAAALALLASCSSLAGEKSGGRYTAPGGIFSLPVPDLSLGARVEDQHGTQTESNLLVGWVSFHDDFGSVRSVRYEQFPSDVARQFSDPARAAERLRGFAHDVMLAGIQQDSPRARIVHEEPVALPDGLSAWFAVLEIPEGSTLLLSSAEHPEGQRLDSTRGFLLLCRADLFFALSAADDFGRVLELDGKEAAPAEAPSPATLDALEGTLVQLYSSMSFR
jgi:hypothetical protein